MIIISDTSPITNLAVIDRLELLPAIFGKIIIPQAVFDEIVVLGNGKPGAEAVQKVQWIEVKTCLDKALVKKISATLDYGESEAIVLALEIKPQLLLIDDLEGREIAEKYKIPIIGLLGILVRAKKMGLIQQVQPVMDELISKAHFRIGKALYLHILKQVGE